jgi:hypothetical protein
MINPAFSFRVEHIGQDQQELLIIDDFVENPQELINCAMQQQDVLPASGHYPGLRSAAPNVYSNMLVQSLSELLCRVFTLVPANINKADSYYSMVSTPVQHLSIIQQLPHFDQPNPNELAVIYYLCNETHGGTSFYCHRSTGYEYIDQARSAHYFTTLENEIKQYGMPRKPCYINDENVFFSKVASIPAKFNRAVIYRCSSLHSGDISPDYKFDLNPMTGRFTIASFIHS